MPRLLSAVIALASVASLPLTFKGESRKAPVILNTQVDNTQSVLTVGGSNFGNTAPSVYLNDVLLNLISNTDTQLVTTLPLDRTY